MSRPTLEAAYPRRKWIPWRTRLTRVWTPIAGVAFLVGCGEGTTSPPPPPPEPEVVFPVLPASVVADFCIRGNLIAPNSASGSVQATGCRTGGFGRVRYYETWRVRVPALAPVVLETQGDFDTTLEVFRITLMNGVPQSMNSIAFNDDFNGLLSRVDITLEPNTEYWVQVAGFDQFSLGTYTLLCH